MNCCVLFLIHSIVKPSKKVYTIDLFSYVFFYLPSTIIAPDAMANMESKTSIDGIGNSTTFNKPVRINQIPNNKKPIFFVIFIVLSEFF